ncbi:hypothetical protein Trydic_g13635 [Trypoxylus dichotomus]
MVVRNIFTICSGIYKRLSCKWHSKKLPKCRILAKFSRKKHLRYRRRLKLRRRRCLRPIDEHVVREYLETDCQPPNELSLSASDRILSRLNRGWTLQQTFGLKPEPENLLTLFISPQKYLNHCVFDTMLNRKKTRRKFNYGSLITEFLADIHIMNCYASISSNDIQ